jgi:electron transfer flavoprotein alpha subunit
VLVVAEHSGGRLSPATAKVVKCASSVPDAEIAVVVFATDCAAVAEQAAAIAGVGRVLCVNNMTHEHALAALIAPQLAEIAVSFSHVFGPSTTFGKDLMPRTAALLGTAQISDIMAVEAVNRFRRPIYAGNAVATVETGEERIVATVRIASFQPAAGGGSAVIEHLQPVAALPSHTRFVALSASGSDRPDLQSAGRVVSGGRALGSAGNFQLIYALADALVAAVGASRAAVDAGFAASDLQVGQTGKIIAPELYVAVGISGAIQHLTGIKDARTIVAINKDSEAPIFEVADLGLVGDLFALLPELTKLLATSRS